MKLHLKRLDLELRGDIASSRPDRRLPIPEKVSTLKRTTEIE